MKRNNAEPIGKLIQQFLRQESLESPLNEQRLLDAWPQILGPAIASYKKELYIRNQILYVHLTSAALRQELMMGRELLVRNLNQKVGATVITNIIFRLKDLTENDKLTARIFSKHYFKFSSYYVTAFY